MFALLPVLLCAAVCLAQDTSPAAMAPTTDASAPGSTAMNVLSGSSSTLALRTKIPRTSAPPVPATSGMPAGTNPPSTMMPAGTNPPSTMMPAGSNPPSTMMPAGTNPPSTMMPAGSNPPSTMMPGSTVNHGTDFPPSTMMPTVNHGTDFPPTTVVPEKNCNNQKADVIFLVDSSGSVGATNFMKQQNYLADLVKNLNVGPDAIRVGLVTFSNDAHLQFNLQDHMDKARLELALGFVPYQSGATYTDEGLKYVRENSFAPSVGGRPDAQKVVVVLTDGKSTDHAKTKTEARLLRINGTIVISLGIGSNVDQQELLDIASGANYTLTAQGFDSLNTTLDLITRLTCEAVTGNNPAKDLVVSCEQRAVDLAFLLDTSSSEGTAHFHEQLQFAQEFVKTLDVGPTKYQVAAATFGSSVFRQFYLNQYDSTQSVVDALGQIPYSGGSTYTQKALAYARETLFKDGYGRRPGTPKVVVVMTDGQSTSKTQTQQEADKLKADGFIVYSIGVGNGVDMTEVTGIASSPDKAFQVTSFSDLQKFLPTLQTTYCGHVDEIIPIIPTEDPSLAACGTVPSDVVFVLDSSSSEGVTNFRKQLDFAGNLTQALKIGVNNVQVGVMTFSTTPSSVFYLNRYTNKYDVLDAIHRTPYRSGATYTGDALRYVRETMLSTLHGRRLGAQPVVIVLTDGQSTQKSETIAEANALKATGAVVIAIGIGSRVDDSEMNAIASDPSHKFNVNTFDFLASIQQQIVKETCEGSGLATKAPHPECGNKPADIVFLMDASSSEGSLNFEKMKAFVADFSQQFVLGSSNVQISCVVFSTAVHVEFYLNETTSQRDLLNKISNIRYYGGTTMTDKGFETVRTDVLLQSHGARPNAQDTVILLTDGRSVVAAETRRQANLLKAQGVEVIAIGVGSSVDSVELEAVASDVQHAFTVLNFNALHTIEQELVDAACQACNGSEVADILLIIDTSSDESAALFTKEMNFIENLVSSFTVGPNAMQFALMTFATKVNMEFWFNTYNNEADIKDALQKVIYTQGDTNTHLALQFAREYGYLPFHGTRQNEKQYVIIVTDGTAANKTAAIEEADKLKAEGKTVIAVGIGAKADKAELEQIATDASHVFIADNADALATIHKEINTKTCTSIFELPPTAAAGMR